MTKDTHPRPTDAELATAAITYIGSGNTGGVDLCGPVGSDGDMDIIGWEPDPAHTGEWTLEDADAHLASLGLIRTGAWGLTEAPEVAGDAYECTAEIAELQWCDTMKAHWEDESHATFVPTIQRAWTGGVATFAVSDGTIREEELTRDKAVARFLDFIEHAIDNASGGDEVTYWRGVRADAVNLLPDAPSPLHATWSDAVTREVEEPLGEDAADFAIHALASETLAEYAHRNDKGALVKHGYYSAVSTEEFRRFAPKHDVSGAALDRVNAYEGDNIWQDVILRLDGYNENATENADPNGLGDVFVIARRLIRFDPTRKEWFSAETVDEYREDHDDDETDL